jgi:ferredoxin
MPHVISSACNRCGLCALECPAECIRESEGKYWVDPDECSDCEACQRVCPVDCISVEGY